MKNFLMIALILNFALPCFAVSYEDINMPKPPAYRTGLSETPEKEYMEAKAKEDKVHQEYVKKDADRKSTRLNSSHPNPSRMPSSA